MFNGIFAANLLFNLIQIKLANPIELLHGGKQGEKEPKTKVIMTIIGVAALGGGYYIAQTTESPLTAMGLFFVAVILVIIGTYALFTAGSIALLKLLKKNKKILLQYETFYICFRNVISYETKCGGTCQHLYFEYDGACYGLHNSGIVCWDGGYIKDKISA